MLDNMNEQRTNDLKFYKLQNDMAVTQKYVLLFVRHFINSLIILMEKL